MAMSSPAASSSRLDRLFLLLETGSNFTIRATAAQRIGETAKKQIHNRREWTLLLNRILPYVKASSWDTRIAAGQALKAIAHNTPPWDVEKCGTIADAHQGAGKEDRIPKLDFGSFDIVQVLQHGKFLLGSVGNEYDLDLHDLNQRDVLQRQQRNLKNRLGLGSQFLDVDLIEDVDIVSNATSDVSLAPKVSAANTMPEPSSVQGLSARERNKLKRKQKLAARRQESLPLEPISTDTGDKSGLKVGPVSSSNSAQLEFSASAWNDDHESMWPFERFCEILSVFLVDPAWEARHGAAIALREILKVHGAGGGKILGLGEDENTRRNQKWLEDVAVRLLCVFALDRFGDFVGDQVVVPVREMCAQALGVCLKYMNSSLVLCVKDSLLGLVNAAPRTVHLNTDLELASSSPRSALWQVKHAGLLGLKYLMAVRVDMVDQLLPEVFPAVVSGMEDDDDDVRAVSCESLVPIAPDFVRILPDQIRPLLKVLWRSLLDLDDITISTATTMDLLSRLSELEEVVRVLVEEPEPASPEDYPERLDVAWRDSVPSLFALFRHPNATVRLSVLRVIKALAKASCSKPPADRSWVDKNLLQVIFQNFVLEEKETVLASTLELWNLLMVSLFNDKRLLSIADPQKARVFFALSMTPIGTPLSPELLELYNAVEETDSATLESSGKRRTRGRRKHQGPAKSQASLDIRASEETETTQMNLDAAMIQQDIGVLRHSDILRGRLAAAKALGLFMALVLVEESRSGALRIDFTSSLTMSYSALLSGMLNEYLISPSACQRHLAAVALEEMLVPAFDKGDTSVHHVIDFDPVRTDQQGTIQSLIVLVKGLLDPALYGLPLNVIVPRSHAEVRSRLETVDTATAALCHAFQCQGLQTFVLRQDLSKELTDEREINLALAKELSGRTFDNWCSQLRQAKKEVTDLFDKQKKLRATLEELEAVQKMYDRRVAAGLAAAVVASARVPDKLNPIVRSLMGSVKAEDNSSVQHRSAVALCRLVSLSTVRPAIDKILKNVCAFTCSDPEATPLISRPGGRESKGIYTIALQEIREGPAHTPKKKNSGDRARDGTRRKLERDKMPIESGSQPGTHAATEKERQAAELARRGGTMVLQELSDRFQDELFARASKLWGCIHDPLRALKNLEWGSEPPGCLQDAVDAFYLLETLARFVSTELRDKLSDMLEDILEVGLKSGYSVLRYMASRALAVLCDVVTTKSMIFMVDKVLPMLSDASNILSRQGASEALHHTVRVMNTSILPFIVFFIIPVLGRMSDPDPDVRRTVTTAFATLVKLIPLEEGIPDPANMPKRLLIQREEERGFLSQLFDPKKLDTYHISVEIFADLRKYQREGVNWLGFLNKYQLHGILCDDMGLGKTLQTICVVASDHNYRRCRFQETASAEFAICPSIVVCPSTVTGHWLSEVDRYTASLKPVCFVGLPSERQNLLKRLHNYDLVVVSYEVLRNDIDALQDIQWNYAVLDEGHIIRNTRTKITKAVKRLKSLHRLILSGTPIQNNVLELWSLFDFLMPGFLGTERQFMDLYSKPILASKDAKKSSKEQEEASLALDSLHRQVLPFLMRRLKDEVLDDLPPKIIQDHYCDLSPIQFKLYERFAKLQVGNLEQEMVLASNEAGKKRKPVHVFNALQYLRKLCNHPLLVLNPSVPDYKSICSGLDIKPDEIRKISNCPKLLALKQLLLDCGIGAVGESGTENASSSQGIGDSAGAVSQHRALVFCQLKTMIDIIEQDLFAQEMPSVSYLRLDGSVETSKRQGVVTKFNRDPSVDVLLLTTHVGGLGLNLTSADTVIFIEHDWNPMKDLQAMDRAHRLGQKKVVNVYRLITRRTLEEKIMGQQQFKINVAKQVINQQNSRLATMNSDQILDLFSIGSPEHAPGNRKRPPGATAGNVPKKLKETTCAVGHGIDGVPATASGVMEHMQELWDDRAYEEEHDIDTFMADL